jgi:hypothetical protein
VARRENVTSSELMDAYEKANESRFRIFNEFNQIINDLRSIGKTDSEIKQILRRAGVSDVGPIMRGRYKPFEMSSSVRRDMRRKGTYDQYPRREINEIRDRYKNRQYTTTMDDEQTTTVAPTPVKDRPFPFTRNVQPPSTAPVQTSNLNTGQQINSSLASLLGSNPIEAAKNMEILQRRNQ